MMHKQAREIVDFWFSNQVKALWFKPTSEFDAQLREKYATRMQAACAGELRDWADTAQGALALIILLDQLPRNVHRGEPASFASDAQALAIAGQSLEAGFDTQVDAEQRPFFYLPFMHSESLVDQDRSVLLFETAGLENNLKWARSHREIVRRFGRFPHRNQILGRESTPEEVEWLNSPEGFNP